MSSTAGVIDALLAVFRSVLTLDVDVIDGGPYDPATDTFVCVGWAGPGQSAGSLGFASPPRSEDAGEVACLLSTRDGSGSPASLSAVRADAETLFRTLKAAVAADPTLAGAAMQAWMPGYDYQPDTSDEGFTVQLRFSVFAQLMP